MTKQSLRAVLTTTVTAAGLMLALASDVQAAPITFSCPAGAECNGATYALALTNTTNLGGGLFEYEITFGINTTGYNGNSTDLVHAVSFKNVVSSFTNLALTSAPGGVGAWNVFDTGLNAKGCKDDGELGACAEAISFGAPVSPAGELFWVFTFRSTETPGPFGHIKFMYVEDELNHKGEFKKVGSLGSFDVPLQNPPPPPDVPEPASMALFGMALAASAGRYYRARRQ